MYLLFNLGKYSVRVNEQTMLLEIEKSKDPMPYPVALKLASQDARADSENYQRHIEFRPRGERIGEAPDNTHLYHFTDDAAGKTAR